MPERPVRPRWFWYLPSMLLIVGATHQLWLVATASLSPWWGGGFGMFATTDAWATRHLHVFAIRPGVRRELAIPQTLRTKVERVLVLPSDTQLRTLAYEFADAPTPDEGPLEAIELQVWATHFDPDTLTPSSTQIRFLTVRMSEP